MSKTIALSNGGFAVIDDEDFAFISERKWSRTRDGYARAGVYANGKKGTIMMHRFVLGTDSSVDHINGDKLDNRRSNLRLANKSQNGQNCFPRNGSSKYKGVCWHNSTKKWRAKITVNNKRMHLGCFANEEDAAHAYNEMASKHFGEFARPNIIQKGKQ